MQLSAYEVAVRVPVTDPDTLRIRLRFIADAWRIDQLAVAATACRPEVATTRISTVTSSGASPEWLDMVRSGVEASDTDYAMTVPGQQFAVSYQVDATPAVRIGAELAYVLALAVAVPAGAVQHAGAAPDGAEVAHVLATIRAAAERYADVNDAVDAGAGCDVAFPRGDDRRGGGRRSAQRL